jgi:kynurenine 3-monooxygenase
MRSGDEQLVSLTCYLTILFTFKYFNSIEMRHSVTTPSYLFKKAVDGVLYSLTSRRSFTLASLTPLLSPGPFPAGQPSGWLPLYTMVTFRPDIGYATARHKAERQSRILSNVGWLSGVMLATAGLSLAWNQIFRRQ